ncbi:MULTISPECIES: toxin [unclassified Streptomyces]|uniref:toxin n=1 Tax=unclassified Streptomyces TaxID=2593676 RepID=UPI001319F21F|nr:MULTISPECIES: toxin [unclassified Streptomyces]MYY05529.1 toxin [Streptomyces sp. SID4913]
MTIRAEVDRDSMNTPAKSESPEPSAVPSKRYFRKLRRQCSARLADLDVPDGDRNVLTLRDRLSERRGRPIHLVPMAIPRNSVNGMWLATGAADFVIYAASASRSHQEHIIAHELGHIMCDHQSLSNTDDDILTKLFPDISPAVVRRVLQRNKYSDRNEQEAEMIASLYCARIGSQGESPAPLPTHGDVIGRLRMAVSGDYHPERAPMGL